jgi:hypothetical protein
MGKKMPAIPAKTSDRLKFLLEMSWAILFKRIVSGKTTVNKEASLQLHYASIIQHLGTLLCIRPSENFDVELESRHGKQSIDITCGFGTDKAAIELKCFKKRSNRPVDIDMYSVLADLQRLQGYTDFKVRQFVCLTDNPYYARGPHTGHAGSVSLMHGKSYLAATPITPSWQGQWKTKAKFPDITLSSPVTMNWKKDDKWCALHLYM